MSSNPTPKSLQQLSRYFSQLSVKKNSYIYVSFGVGQISLLKILQYIILKTSRGLHEYKWTCNAVKLGLETAICCHDEQMWPEMKFSLADADFYMQQHNLSDLPLEFQAPFLLNQSLFNILHLLWMHCNSDINNAEIVHLLPSLIDDSLKLNQQQTNFVCCFCYNVGLSCFRQELYVGAIHCLKTSLYFGIYHLLLNFVDVIVILFLKAKHLGKQNAMCHKRLSLLAHCFFNLNMVEHSDEIHHILSCTGKCSICYNESNICTFHFKFIRGKCWEPYSEVENLFSHKK